METPVYALICGNYRVEQEFYDICSTLASWREQGIVTDLLWSTWHDEQASNPRAVQIAREFHLEVIESDPPKDPQHKVHSHYLHQQKSLEAGLRALPDDVFVFKCRSDRVIPDETHLKFLQYFTPEWLEVTHRYAEQFHFSLPYTHKIVGHAFDLLEMLRGNDKIYFGKRECLLNLIEYSLAFLGISSNRYSTPESSLWGVQCIRQMPIVHSYVWLFDRFARAQLAYDAGQEMFIKELQNDYFCKVFASVAAYFNTFYHMGFHVPPHPLDHFYNEAEFRFLDLLNDEFFKVTGIARRKRGEGAGYSFICHTPLLFKRMLEGTIAPCEQTAKLFRVFPEVLDSDFHRSWNFSLREIPDAVHELAAIHDSYGIKTEVPNIQRY